MQFYKTSNNNFYCKHSLSSSIIITVLEFTEINTLVCVGERITENVSSFSNVESLVVEIFIHDLVTPIGNSNIEGRGASKSIAAGI